MKSKNKYNIIIYIVVITIFCQSAGPLTQTALALGANDLLDVRFNWARPAVNYVLEKGYMSGISTTRFAPSGTVTRAQVAQVLYQRAGAPEADPYGGPFIDVPPESWYGRAVEWCRRNGVISGVEHDRFAPKDPVTREQVCLMTLNFCREHLGATTDTVGDISAYTDWRKASWWAREALGWATGTGFMNGVSDSKLEPKGRTTREQLAQLLYNLDTKVLGLDPGTAGEDPPLRVDTVPLANKGDTKLIAHQGGGGLGTGNTMEAFNRSGSRSYWGLECDVQRTKDGEYVAFHDTDLLHMTGQPGRVADYTLKELQSFRLRGGQYVPTLREYLAACGRYKKQAVIDIKGGDPLEIADIVRDMGYLKETTFLSFDLEDLTALRKRLPDQSLMLNCDVAGPLGGRISVMRANNIGCNSTSKCLTREQVNILHESGLKVGCWTVNHPEDAEKLISWGVDYLTTDILE